MKRFNLFKMPKGCDVYIHLSILVLAAFGLLMITSASMGSVSDLVALAKVMFKQILFIGAGYIGMVIISRLYTHELGKFFSKTICSATIIALLAPLACEAVGGAHAWIKLPGVDFSIQPSEFAKISVILVMSLFLGDIKNQKLSDKELCKAPIGLVLFWVFIVVVLQSDTGSGVIMLAVAAVLFFIPSHRSLRKWQKRLFILGIFGVATVVFLMTPLGKGFLQALPLAKYQIKRFLSASNPFLDKYGSGFQLIKGLTAFASGGWTGLGLGNSIQKYTNFPAANTDYILSVVVEELGISGFIIIFLAYMTIIWRLIRHAYNCETERDQMVLIGVATILFVHTLFNIGGVTGLIPLTGVPLLLISSGGSSTMAYMLAIGLAQSIISKNTKKNEQEEN